jgi:hypothetical protein
VKQLPHVQGSVEWLAARAGIATASCFSAIMATIKSGEAAERRNYRAQLVVERLTGKAAPSFQTDAMRLGIEREPLARQMYESLFGNLVDEVGLCLHDELECGASPDGLVDSDGGLEIKCPGLAKHLEYLRLKAEPPEYTWQIQGCMWITGRQWWDFVSFNPDFPEDLQMVARRIPRDEVAIQRLADKVASFMDEVRAEVEEVRNLRKAA